MSHPTRGAWRDNAACQDHDTALFFPEATMGARRTDYEPALAVCRGCEVLEECYRWATAAGDVVDGHTTHGQVVAGCAPRPRTVERPPVRRAPCGTPTAYKRHLRDGEEPCQQCREASRQYRATRPRRAS